MGSLLLSNPIHAPNVVLRVARQRSVEQYRTFVCCCHGVVAVVAVVVVVGKPSEKGH